MNSTPKVFTLKTYELKKLKLLQAGTCILLSPKATAGGDDMDALLAAAEAAGATAMAEDCKI